MEQSLNFWNLEKVSLYEKCILGMLVWEESKDLEGNIFSNPHSGKINEKSAGIRLGKVGIR